MKTKVLFKTDNDNYYMQDIINDYLIYLHPKMKRIIYNNDNAVINSESNNEYYKRKFVFLNSYLFSNLKLGSLFSKELTSDAVLQNLINTKQVCFEVTENCNLECKYCGYGEFYNNYDERSSKNLEWNIAKSLIDYLKAFWTSIEYPSFASAISIGFYGGEPLLNIKLIKKIVTYLEDIKCCDYLRFTYHLTTNGILLNQHIDYLKEMDFIIHVSLDGAEENNSYRVDNHGDNSFNNVVKNLIEVRNKYPHYFNTNIYFLSVLHNRNSVDEIHTFFKNNFNKKSRISEVNPVGIRQDKIDDFLLTYSNKYDSIYNSDNYDLLTKELFIDEPRTHGLMRYLHAYSGNVIKDYQDLFFEKKDKKYLPTGTCTPFSQRVFLSVRGKILPCERIGHQYSIGSIENGKIKIDINEISKDYNERYKKLFKQCSSCYNIKNCLKCMFHISKLDIAPLCDSYLNEDNIKQSLSSNISWLESKPELYNKIMKEVVII